MKLKDLQKDNKNLLNYVELFKHLTDEEIKLYWLKMKTLYGNRIVQSDMEELFISEGLEIIGSMINLDSMKWKEIEHLQDVLKALIETDTTITETHTKTVEKMTENDATSTTEDTDSVNAWDFELDDDFEEVETVSNVSSNLKTDTNKLTGKDNQNIKFEKQYRKTGFNKDKINLLLEEMKSNTDIYDVAFTNIVDLICLNVW